MKNIPIFFGFLFCSLNSILGQNYLFKPNQSGLHLSIQYYNPGHQNTFVINPGYTFDGRLTTGLIGSFSEGIFSYDKIYGGNASYMLIKEGIDMPFSLSIDGSYLFGKYKTIDNKYNTLRLGPSIYKRIALFKKLSLIPGFNISHNWYTSDGPTFKYTDKYWTSSFQLTALYNKFQITASTNKTINQNYVAIGAGFILPIKN